MSEELKELKPLKRIAEAKAEKAISKTVVVSQLPTEPIKKVIGEDGSEYELVTVEEALSEMLEISRLMKKSLL